MPRWNPFSRARRPEGAATNNNPEREELATLAPGIRRMRTGGRAQFTTFSEVPAKSQLAIQRTFDSLAQEESAFKRVFFKRIFSTLSPEQLNSLRRLGTNREELVDSLSSQHNVPYLRQLIGHEKIVQGTKVAADRFAKKNVAEVLLNATRGKRGLMEMVRPSLLFNPGSAREDVASGFLAAIEQTGLPGRPHEAPHEAPRRPHAAYGRREPAYPEPEHMFEPGNGEPLFDVHGAGFEAHGEGEFEAHGESRPADYSLLNMLTPEAKPIRVQDFAVKGIQSHSRDYFDKHGSDTVAKHAAVGELFDHAAGYVGHLMGNAMNKRDAEAVVNNAMKNSSVTAFHGTVSRVVKNSSRGTSTDVLEDFHLPTGAKLFDQTGKEVSKVTLLNWKNLKYRTNDGQSQDLTHGQKQAVAFHLLAQLVKHGSPVNGALHLKRFMLKTHQDLGDSIEAARNLAYAPRKISGKDMRRVLTAMALAPHEPQQEE